ncbi:MAG TPA: NAD(P)-dependent oxidoreductase [Candidatus Bathyarchaeia archaeon]|nr:NAD(P)-dependent oxidoreductase [Candidatus Bathyarchaeia archaeon]
MSVNRVSQDHVRSKPVRPVVGFVGIGRMGKRMATNILKAGYKLVVWSRTPGHARELESLGASVASCPKDVAERSSIVITMLADPKSTREVYSGKNGLMEGLHAKEIFIDMTTNLPSLSRSLAKEIEEKEGEFLDAPVSGSIKPASEGTLLILVGGKKDTLEIAKPILQTMGNRIIHTGGHGSAASMKLVLQMHSATIMVSFAESLAFGQSLGLDPLMILEILNSSVLKTYASENKGKKVIEADYTPQHSLESMTENLDLVSESARDARITMPPLLKVAREIFHSAKKNGEGELDFSAVAIEIERIMQTKISRGH